MEEGTSRNVPIAGFEMILREDYKSRDEVEGLIFFPKYHLKPQDTGNIPWCSRQQSRHLLYCMATHCLARLRHSSQKFTKLSMFFQRGFPLSCAQCNAYPLYCAPQCNAYPLYCARNKKPVRGLGRSTYMFEAIVSQAQFAICLREKMCGIDQCSSSAALERATYWNVCRSRDCV